MKSLSKNEMSQVGGGNSCLRYIDCTYTNGVKSKSGLSAFCPDSATAPGDGYTMLETVETRGLTTVTFLADVCSAKKA